MSEPPRISIAERLKLINSRPDAPSDTEPHDGAPGRGADPNAAFQRATADQVDAEVREQAAAAARDNAARLHAIAMRDDGSADALRIGWRAIARGGGDPMAMTGSEAAIIHNIERLVWQLQGVTLAPLDAAFALPSDHAATEHAARIEAAIRRPATEAQP